MLGNSLNRSSLRKALRNLPKTLGDTYGRILSNIEEDFRDYALTILRWLAFSARPLDVGEAAEIVAITGNRCPQFDKDQVLEDPLDVLTICSSLVTVIGIRAVGPAPKEFSEKGMKHERRVFSLAHYSVKEYLLSESLQKSTMATFSIRETASQAFIAKCCLGYILQLPDRTTSYWDIVDNFQLATYAAEFWPYHLQAAGDHADSVHDLVMELLSARDDAYLNWFRIFDVDKQKVIVDEDLRPLPDSLYTASAVGLTDIVRVLLAKGNFDINRKSGYYGSALQVASGRGHAETVGLLLDMGADINSQSDVFGTPLQAASAHGHMTIVERLIASGADVNIQGGRYGTALMGALVGGHHAIVDQLLEAGADIHLQGGIYDNPLQAASYAGNTELIRTLLKTGAEINKQGGQHGTALHAAASNGHSEAVELLLEAGADANLGGGEYGYALQAASANNRGKIVDMLLNAGANVNAQGGLHITALHAAIAEKADMDVIERLLRAGADISAQTPRGNALHIATRQRRVDVVDRLLKEGVDVNSCWGSVETVLLVALAAGDQEIIDKLLKVGADINAIGPRGSAQEVAAEYGYSLEVPAC
jgi:ankyrin repeat protein